MNVEIRAQTIHVQLSHSHKTPPVNNHSAFYMVFCCCWFLFVCFVFLYTISMMRRNLKLEHIRNSSLYSTPTRGVIFSRFPYPARQSGYFIYFYHGKTSLLFLHAIWLLNVCEHSSIRFCLHQKKAHCWGMTEKEWKSLAKHKNNPASYLTWI